MSLDDKFNPNDGSLIDTVDSTIFEFNKKIAEKWQDKTYRNKSDLETVLYFGSAAFFGIYAINEFPLMAIGAATSALKGSVESLRSKSAKHEEMAMEVVGLPRKTAKYAYVLSYGFGAFETLVGFGCLSVGAISGNSELYMDSLNSFAFGLGFLALVSADYMSRSDTGAPPPKPKKKPILGRIREKVGGLFPKPATQPVTVGDYNVLESYYHQN